jgi:molecular chaperone DnaJ
MCKGYGYIITDPCDACNGAGRVRATTENKVDIPAGVESGMRIRLRGEGDAGAHGGSPGDLYVVIRVKPHKRFERHGDDIVCELPIDYVQAALGDTIEVPNLHDNEELHIPAGTQTGTSFKLKGKGIPNINSGVRGDEHVVVRIVTPTKLNDDQKKLLLEFGKSRGVETTPTEGKNFFEKLLGK